MISISEKIIKPKLGLLEIAKELGNVSKACNVMGYFTEPFFHLHNINYMVSNFLIVVCYKLYMCFEIPKYQGDKYDGNQLKNSAQIF